MRYKYFGGVEKKSREKTRGAHARKAERLKWVALQDHWFEEMRERFGYDVDLSPWGPKDVQSAKRIVARFGIDRAKKMATICISRWRLDDLPGIGFLWAKRDSFAAILDGKVTAKKAGVKRGEFSQNLGMEGPAHGW